MFKKKIIAIILSSFLIFGGFVLSGCGQTPVNEDKIVIYTTIYPLYDFATKVGGDKVEVINLVKPGEEAHDYEPTINQMAGLYDADLIVINGLGVETWIENINTELINKILDTSIGTTVIARTENEDNANFVEVGDAHEHTEEDEHEHGTSDPHIWLSLKNAKKQMENIKDALIVIDSENASYYQNNYDKYAMLFDGLDNQFTSLLSMLENKNFVVSHRAFGYIAYEYGLFQYSLNDFDTDGEPDLETLQYIVDFITANNIQGVFYQEFSNTQVASFIKQQTNAEIYRLSTLEGLTQKQIDDGEDYLSMMAQNLVNLVNALS